MTESIFNSLEQESEVAPATCKRKREQRREIFDKLYHATSLRIREMEEDLQVELEVRYEEFRDKMAHIDLDHCLRQGPVSGAFIVSAPTALHPPT